jgi:putative salt-induced outer membrane protein YdiY
MAGETVNKTNIPFIFIALAACATARADLVVLQNGDRYTGAVQTLSEDVLNFKTGFGTLALPWGQVVRLETDAPVLVTLADGNKVSGILQTQGERLGFQDQALAGLSLVPSQIVALGPPNAPAVVLEGRLSAGANVSQGNTNAQTYHADAEFIARTAKNRFTLGALVNYGEDDGQAIVDDASAFARYDHFLNDRWYFNSNFSLGHDEFRDLDLRTTFGVGVGYQFVETAAHRLAAELGVSYIHENYEVAPDDSQPAARWGFNYLRRIGGASGPVFTHRHEILVGLDDTDDTLLRSQTGIRSPLFGNLSGGLEVNFDYDWQPPAGTENQDVSYLLKLIYEI